MRMLVFLLLIINIGCGQTQSNTDSMNKTNKENWYKGEILINSNLTDVGNSLNDLGKHYLGLVSIMPGLTTVELIEQGNNFVKIKTNEGIMLRSNITINSTNDKITIEFDEEYKAGSAITATSHFIESYEPKDSSLLYKLEINNLQSPGFLGFFYRNFGSKNIGKSFLDSNKKLLEK